MDDTEYQNYKALHVYQQHITRYMPQFFGETVVDKKRYMVLENLLSNGTDSFTPLADIKLSGKVEGIHPIASQDEMRVTRGALKGICDREWMRFCAKHSPHYMVVQGKGLQRFINYRNSEKILSGIINQLSEENKASLIKETKNILYALKTGDVALIGSSLLLIQNPLNGSVRPVLIDPAHVQYGNLLIDSQIIQDTSKLFSEKMAPQKYEKRRESNILSLSAIIETMEKNCAHSQ